jgi:glycosyltransferase involved in cell wall biosynthesis
MKPLKVDSNRKKILFVHDDDPQKPLSTFFLDDIHSLQRWYDVKLFSVASYHHLHRDPFADLNAWRSIAACDAVFGWFGSCSPFVIMAAILKKPSVIIAGGYDVVYIPEIGYGLNPKNKIWYYLLLLGYRMARKILLFSESSRNTFINLPGMKAEKAQTLYLGIDTERFKPLKTKSANVITFCYMSEKSIQRKGLLTLLETARITPEISYRIGGRIVDPKAFNQLTEHAPPNILFLTDLTDNQVLEELQSAKIYAQLSFHEGFGMAVGEAMACGCIPVVTNRGSLPEVVGDAGIFVPVNDPFAAAQSIRKIIKSDGTELSSRARARIVNLFQPIFREKGLRIVMDDILPP